MRYTNRIKRIADSLEKLGVVGLGIGIFQNRWGALLLGLIFLLVSINLTDEDRKQ